MILSTLPNGKDWRTATHAVIGPAAPHGHSGPGMLSLKACWGGAMEYRVGPGRHRIDEHGYLIVNDGQSYAFEPQPDEGMRRCILFFDPRTAGEALANATMTEERLLDDGVLAFGGMPRFFEHVRPYGGHVTPVLRAIASAGRGTDPAWLEERCRLVLERLVEAEYGLHRAARRLDAARPATRAELLRRVMRARDLVDATPDRVPTLAEMAEAACLSPNHLIRAFRTVMGTTPHQYAAGRRMERAQALLRGGLAVTEVCFAVGYESPSSFSRLFRRTVGMAPEAYRRANASR